MRSERGAMLIHIALSMIALLAFGALAIDYGVMWSARRQAQNAADAAALAGAVSLATNGSDWDRARAVAEAIGEANYVFGQHPQIDRGSGKTTASTDDISFPLCPPGSPGAGEATCIRVNVYRNESRNPLPTFLAHLFGRSQQGVRAMAMAEAAAGNATNCLRPFAVPDLWLDNDSNEIFSASDVYRDPNDEDPTGYNVDDHLGFHLLLHGDSKDPPRVAPGWFYLADITGGGGGTNELRNVIRGCIESKYGIGDDLPEKNGDSNGIKHGVEDLIELDPDAYFDPASKTIKNSCVETGTCYKYIDGGDTKVPDPSATISPRVVPLPVFNPEIQWQTGEVIIVNILGFFINPMPNNKDVDGYLINRPDLLVSGSGSASPKASFLTYTLLVR